MNRMEETQIKEELGGDRNSTEIEKNCLNWYNKYKHAYNYWLSLDSSQKEDDTSKERLLSFMD